MTHWRTMLWGLALTCGLATGCKQQIFLAEKDLQAAALMPAGLERDPAEAISPTLTSHPTPADVNLPDRPPRYLTLPEAFAIGLENGTTGARNPGSGIVDETLPSFQGGQISTAGESVRVVSLQPAITQTAIENQLARFDAQWITSMNWAATDNLQQGLQSFQNGQAASFATSFIKAIPSGGTANISFLSDYRLLATPPTGQFGVLNPSYTTRLVFGFEQPLWRDYGVDINQLLTRHPSGTPFSPIPNTHAGSFAGHLSGLSPFAAAPEGILIARVRLDQAKAEFERSMNALILNVEVAYWSLYQAYGRLYTFEELVRIAHRSLMINEAKFKVGQKGPADYYPILGQFQDFRGERTAALADVLDKERILRRFLGLPPEDGTRLVPITPPNMAQYQPNFDAAVRDAMLYRPELVIARENLRVAHFQLLREKNSLKPDLRAAAQYAPVGFGNRLDGSYTFIDGTGAERPQNAFQSLTGSHFNDWSLGLILNVPLGYRAEMANVRAARLSLVQGYYFLKDTEERATSFVTQQYQELSKWYNLIEQRRAARKAYAEAVVARFEQFRAGRETADFLLEAQRRLADAQVKEYEAIAQYNNSLARFEFAKGTILHFNNVFISEGPLPGCAQVRAVEHERERTKAHVLHNRPRPLDHPGRFAQVCGEVVGQPTLVNLDGSEQQDAPPTELPPPRLTPDPVMPVLTPAAAPMKKTSAPTQTSRASMPEASPTPAPGPMLMPNQLWSRWPETPPTPAPVPFGSAAATHIASTPAEFTPIVAAPVPSGTASSPVAAASARTPAPVVSATPMPTAPKLDAALPPVRSTTPARKETLSGNSVTPLFTEAVAPVPSAPAPVSPATVKGASSLPPITVAPAPASPKTATSTFTPLPPAQKTTAPPRPRVSSGIVLVEVSESESPQTPVSTPTFVPARTAPAGSATDVFLPATR